MGGKPQASPAEDPNLIESIKVTDVGGAIINPATKEKQDEIITAIENIPAGGYEVVGIKNSSDARIDPATETTLDNIDTNVNSLIHTNDHTGGKELRVYSEGHICSDNSTSTPLGINGVFTGGWQDTLDYSEVIVTVYTDKNSITDGLDVQWSTDGITVHAHDNFTISATSGKTFTFQCVARYVRVVYTNDGVAQTYFTLQTQLKRFSSKGSSHRLKDIQSQEDDAILTKSLIIGLSSAGGGNLVDVKVNPSGALSVAVGESALPTGAATEATLANIYGLSSLVKKYSISDVDDDASPNYYGFVDSAGNWFIMKETVAVGNTTYRFINGTSGYATNWTNRASLSYDYFNNIF